MGLIGGNGSDQNDSSSSWGRDPVHPLDNAYATMARKLLEEINKEVVMNLRQPLAQQDAADGCPRPEESTLRRLRQQWPAGPASGRMAANTVVAVVAALQPHNTSAGEGTVGAQIRERRQRPTSVLKKCPNHGTKVDKAKTVTFTQTISI